MSEKKPFYTEEYQVKVLAYMLANYQFCDLARDAVEVEHFANRALQWYFNTLIKSSVPLTATTLREELLKSVEEGVIKEGEIEKISHYYTFIKKEPVPSEQEHIRNTFEKFIRTQAMKKAILESTDLIKEEKWDEVVAAVDAARQKGVDILTVGHRFFTDFEARLSDRLNKEDVRRLATGIPAIDELTHGGLRNKQLGLVIGGTGRGKSIFLEWLARVAIMLGKQVVYYTLELSEEDVSDRFDSLFCHVKPQELQSLNKEVFEQLHKYHAKFGNNLIIKEYPEDQATVSTIRAHYKQLAAIGVVPDLIVIDYLDLMKPHRTYHDSNAEQIATVKAVRGLSKELNTKIWSALQLNRGGMAQETPDETGVAGSISRIFTSDIAIVMAQNPEERENEIMRLFLMKNRNGPSPRTVKITTDFGHMTFYRPDAQMDAENAKEVDKKGVTLQDDVEATTVALTDEGVLLLE